MRKEDSIQTIKGIGEKTAESFARLGIFTIDDLLHTYPRNYLSYEEPVCIRDAAVGERHAIRAMITSYVTVKQVRSLKLTILTVSDGDMTMHMTWFNQPFLRNVFHKGDSYIFVGTVKVKNGMRVMEQAEYYKCRDAAGNAAGLSAYERTFEQDIPESHHGNTGADLSDGRLCTGGGTGRAQSDGIIGGV